MFEFTKQGEAYTTTTDKGHKVTVTRSSDAHLHGSQFKWTAKNRLTGKKASAATREAAARKVA